MARNRIAEQDDRFRNMKARAQEDIHGVVALVAITVEDLADTNDSLGEKLDEHCSRPAAEAHPAPVADPAGAGPEADLTPSQKYRLAVMENRGKIIAGISAAIITALTLAFTGGN